MQKKWVWPSEEYFLKKMSEHNHIDNEILENNPKRWQSINKQYSDHSRRNCVHKHPNHKQCICYESHRVFNILTISQTQKQNLLPYETESVFVYSPIRYILSVFYTIHDFNFETKPSTENNLAHTPSCSCYAKAAPRRSFEYDESRAGFSL